MISEPMTLATDYALSLVTGVAAVLTLRVAAGENSRRLWAAAFVALALGAALGGTYHGFHIEPLWLPTIMIVGVASAAMVAGSAFAATRGALRTALIALALAKLALFWAWVWRDPRFIGVVADTGAAFILVALHHLGRWRERGSPQLVAGVALSIVAGVVQASGVDLHPHFNHNDLYHVIQMLAIVAYYRGARVITDFSRA
jgi:uncharacterized protein DUF6962